MGSSNHQYLKTRAVDWARVAICSFAGALLAACGEGEQSNKPIAFSPQRAEVVRQDRIARCNTVHSLTLPAEVQRRYGIAAGDDTAVISCSLHTRQDVPANIPARVSGTATTLTGSRSEIEFREILEQGAVSYVGTFEIDGKAEVRFDIALTDVQSGTTYNVEFRQEQLPGRA